MPSNPETGTGAPIPAPPQTGQDGARHLVDPPEHPGLTQPGPSAPAPDDGPTTEPDPGTAGPTPDTEVPAPGDGRPIPDDGSTTEPVPGTGGPAPGTGVPAPSDVTDPASTDGDFETGINKSLLNLIENASSGDALQAQNILLRRIALQGDVVPSRVPPPLNITEIGGYLNLLADLGETEMRSQMLAGILGVAGPDLPLGWAGTAPPLSLVPIANDRPAGPAQVTLPITVSVRSDVAGSLAEALTALRAKGCMVPFLTGPIALPPHRPNLPAPTDTLLYTGRVLTLAAATAFVDPASDALVLVRTPGSNGPFEIVARAFEPAGADVPVADYEALKATPTGINPVLLPSAHLIQLAPALAAAAFYPAVPLPQPATVADRAWTRLTNVAGLVAGQSRLGDELALLYTWDTIAASAFGSMIEWRWDGTTFTPTP